MGKYGNGIKVSDGNENEVVEMGGTWYERSVPAHLYSKLAWDIAFQPPSGRTILSAIFDNLIIHVSCKNNPNYTSFCCSCIDIDGGNLRVICLCFIPLTTIGQNTVSKSRFIFGNRAMQSSNIRGETPPLPLKTLC